MGAGLASVNAEKAMLLNARIDPLTEDEMQGRPRRARSKKRAAILGEVFSVRVGWIMLRATLL
jgi:hypothetical protein